MRKRKILFTLMLSVLVLNASAQEWLELYNQCITDYENYNLDAAKVKCTQALDIFTKEVSPEHPNVAAILRQLSLITYESGAMDTALVYANRELEILQNLNQQAEANYGNALSNTGQINLAIGNYDQAKAQFEEGLNILRNYYTQDQLEIGEVQGNLATALFYLDDLEAAAVHFEQSIACYDQNNTHPLDYFNTAYAYSDYCIATGKPKPAIGLLDEMAQGLKEEGANTDYASLLVKCASAHEQAGNLDQALANYKTAIQTLENLGNTAHDDYLIAMNNLSMIYQRQGQFAKAAGLMNQVIGGIADQNNPAYFVATTNLGNIQFKMRDFDGAMTSYEKVINQDRDSRSYYFSLSGKGLVLIERGMHQEALSTVNQALASASIDDHTRWQLLKTKAAALNGLGRYEESGKALQNALTLSTPNEQIEIKQRLANLYSIMNQFDNAAPLFEEVNAYYQQRDSRDLTSYATFLGNYSTFLQQTGDYKRADEYLQESIEIKSLTVGENSESYLATYENLAILYFTTGKYILAQEILEEIIDKKQNSDATNSSLAYTLTNLGMLYKTIGEYDLAEENLREALNLYEKEYGANHVFYANSANQLGLLYMKMGNTKAAKPLFESALITFEQAHTKNHPDYASSLENLATLHYMEGNPAQSKILLEEALEIDRQVLGTEHPLYSKTLHNLASTLEELGEYERASRLYEESVNIYSKLFGTEHPSYANTLYNIAVLEQEIGNYEGAKSHFEQVIEIRKKILNENHPDLSHAYFGLASVAQRLGDLERAKEVYAEVITHYLESINSYFPSLSEEEKSAYYAKIKPAFSAFEDFAIEYVVLEKGTVEDRDALLSQLYDLHLATKALLLNSTNKVKNRVMNSGDAGLIAKYNEWKSTKEELVKALNMSNEEVQKNGIDISDLQTKSNDIEKQLSRMSEAFADEYEKQNISWTDVRDQLSSSDAALEILRVKKNTKNDSIYYAGMILRGGQMSKPEMVVIENGKEMEQKFFKQYKNLIVFKMDNNRSYGQFWKAIDQKLGDITNLYLSSDGVYNKININTLYDPDAKEFVFDKYNIYLLSNTREIVETNRAKNKLEVNTATIFGYPDYSLGDNTLATEASTERGFESGISELPGTLEEINHISETLDQYFWKYEKYQRGDANEQNVKKVNSPKLLHIATHGFFMSDKELSKKNEGGLASREAKFNPLFRSGLLLAGASKTFANERLPGGEDGILTAYEAMNLNLDQTELVVMSACETGLGEVKNGEGVYGLQRAFIVAGADNLIMSLWKVNDETTQKLMSRFYANWVSGKEKKIAFNDAISSLKKEYKQPYYWGAFVMLGN